MTGDIADAGAELARLREENARLRERLARRDERMAKEFYQAGLLDGAVASEDKGADPMIDKRDLRELIATYNPDALLADGLESAFVGIGMRCGQPSLAVYSIRKLVAYFVAQGMTEDEAQEHVDFNIVGALVGPGTPIWLDDEVV